MNRRTFLTGLAAASFWPRRAGVQQTVAVPPPPAPVARSSFKYLLLDPRIVERTDNTTLRLGTVAKHPRNPLFVQDKPWEMRWDNADPAVLFDEEERIYKAWYSPMIHDEATAKTPPADRGKVRYYAGERDWCTCYAVSKDGIAWEKPDLGIVEFRGSKRNNLVSDSVGSVVKDARDPDPARRYKVLGAKAVRFSPDGLHWSPPVACPEIRAVGDTHKTFVWDERTRRYVGFTRLWEPRKTKEGHNVRIVARTESPDFVKWTPAVEVLRGGPDPQMQTYALVVFPHADIYLGLIALFDVRRDFVHCELAWSPDTVRWERVCPGEAMIPRGPEGAFDWGCIYAAASPIVRDGEIRLYYAGSDGPHTSWRSGGLGLARLRPDGFAGMQPSDAGRAGRIVTRPVECAGPRLHISADAGGGSVAAGVLDDERLGLDRCGPITADCTDASVRWRDGRDLSALVGRKVRLVFELKSARLYAFAFGS